MSARNGENPAKHWKIVWSAFYLGFVIDLAFLREAGFTMFLIGYFVAAEYIALTNTERDDSLTEFTYWLIPNPMIRWFLAILLSGAAILLINVWIGLALFLYLTLHYADKDMV